MLNEALQGSLQKWKYYLHPSQASMVNRILKAVKLSGEPVQANSCCIQAQISGRAKIDRAHLVCTPKLSKNLEHLAIQLQVKTGAYHAENIDSLAFD